MIPFSTHFSFFVTACTFQLLVLPLFRSSVLSIGTLAAPFFPPPMVYFLSPSVPDPPLYLLSISISSLSLHMSRNNRRLPALTGASPINRLLSAPSSLSTSWSYAQASTRHSCILLIASRAFCIFRIEPTSRLISRSRRGQSQRLLSSSTTKARLKLSSS